MQWTHSCGHAAVAPVCALTTSQQHTRKPDTSPTVAPCAEDESNAVMRLSASTLPAGSRVPVFPCSPPPRSSTYRARGYSSHVHLKRFLICRDVPFHTPVGCRQTGNQIHVSYRHHFVLNLLKYRKSYLLFEDQLPPVHNARDPFALRKYPPTSC
jgi:hypothetical protein